MKEPGSEEYIDFYKQNNIPIEKGALFVGEIRTLFVRTGEVDAEHNIPKRMYHDIIQEEVFRKCKTSLENASFSLQQVFMEHYNWGYEEQLAIMNGTFDKVYLKRR